MGLVGWKEMRGEGGRENVGRRKKKQMMKNEEERTDGLYITHGR
jgi:hypothetical protein